MQGQNIADSEINSRPVVILLDGVLIYQYAPLLKHFDLRYFITLTKEEALRRRVARRYCYSTGEEIIFDRAGYFERYAWPCYLDSLCDIQSQPSQVKSTFAMSQPSYLTVLHQLLSTTQYNIYKCHVLRR